MGVLHALFAFFFIIVFTYHLTHYFEGWEAEGSTSCSAEGFTND